MTINGWGLTGPRSTTRHAVPTPTDLGDHGRALCGKRPSTRTGWIEDPDGYRDAGRWGRCRRCVRRAAA